MQLCIMQLLQEQCLVHEAPAPCRYKALEGGLTRRRHLNGNYCGGVVFSQLLSEPLGFP